MRSLRILFLAGRDPGHPRVGGGDVQAWIWARWAAGQGHSVTFIGQSADGLRDEEVIDNVRILRFGKGVQLPWRAWRYFRQNRCNIDLVYDDPIGAGRLPYLSPLYVRVPIVAVWHQVSAQLLRQLYSPPVAYVGSLLERLLARVYRRCQLWTPSVESADELVAKLRFKRPRIHVIPPTVSADIILQDTVARTGAIALCLGVIRRYKSVDHAIRALEKVIALVPDARLIVAGRAIDDAYITDLTQLAEELDLSTHVTMRFNISEEEKYRLLNEARVLILPSVLEGFGIVTMEANAVGTPVVASSGVPTAAVEDNVNGLRYEYGDIDQLALCVASILQDDALFARLAAAGITHTSRFTTDSVAIDFERLLESALGERDV